MAVKGKITAGLRGNNGLGALFIVCDKTGVLYALFKGVSLSDIVFAGKLTFFCSRLFNLKAMHGVKQSPETKDFKRQLHTCIVKITQRKF